MRETEMCSNVHNGRLAADPCFKIDLKNCENILLRFGYSHPEHLPLLTLWLYNPIILLPPLLLTDKS